MKKNYIMPKLTVVQLNMKQTMLAGSPNGQNFIDPSDTTDAEVVDARENSFIKPSSVWDE